MKKILAICLLCHINVYANSSKNAESAYKEGNISKALELYTKSCNNGDVSACHSVGVIYEEKNSMDKAIEYYTMSCKSEHSFSCFNLGLLYYNGKGIDKNENEAIKFFKKACLLGDNNGCVNWGALKYD